MYVNRSRKEYIDVMMDLKTESLTNNTICGIPWVCFEDVLELSQNPRFQDVTILCDGGKIHVNSFLLASIFPIVRHLFDATNEAEMRK